MPEDSLKVSVPEVVCANSAMIRVLLAQLVNRGVLSSADLHALFALTKQDLSDGRYEPSAVAGAQAYVDNLRQNIEAPTVLPQSGTAH
ncbi:MAG: hypothetical protein ACE5KF_08520 [Kiloniellaceae bacterium]